MLHINFYLDLVNSSQNICGRTGVPATQRKDPSTRQGDHAWQTTAQRLMLGSYIYVTRENYYYAIQDWILQTGQDY